MSNFPFYKQADHKDCGPTCLKIIAKHYKKTIPIQELRNLSETTREGSSLLGISEAAEKIGFRSLGVKISLNDLLEAPLPCILHWNKNHYIVLYRISSKKGKFWKKETIGSKGPEEGSWEMEAGRKKAGSWKMEVKSGKDIRFGGFEHIRRIHIAIQKRICKIFGLFDSFLGGSSYLSSQSKKKKLSRNRSI